MAKQKYIETDLTVLDQGIDSEEAIVTLEDGLPLLSTPTVERMGQVADAMIAQAMTNVYLLSRSSRDIKLHLEVGKFAMMAGKYAMEKEATQRKEEMPDVTTLNSIWQVRDKVDEAEQQIYGDRFSSKVEVSPFG